MSVPSNQGMGRTRKQYVGKGSTSLQARTGVTFQPGSLVVRRHGSLLAETPLAASPRNDLILIGTFVGTSTYTSSSVADANGGALDPVDLVTKQMVQIQPLSASGTLDFATGTGANKITSANIDDPVYIYDDDTFWLTDNGGQLSWGGYVVDVDANTGRVVIKHSEQYRQFYELYSANQGTYGLTADDTAQYVATNIPAGTFSGGVFTATATGAFPTQDGVTVALGDKMVIPPGTITTQAVTAAQSGVYECTALGATGVKAVWTRTAKWAHGATIVPGTRIRVQLGAIFAGTTWRADPANLTSVVDTDDPLLFPERVVVAGTCALGTFTISTIPLRAAGKFAVLPDFTGGSPAATTTSLQASTQTPGGIGTASIVIQEQDHLGHLVNTGTATANVLITQ